MSQDLETSIPLATAANSDTFHLELEEAAARSNNRFHHPKLTGYRVLVLGLTLRLGLSKAVLSYRAGNSQSYPVTSLDLVCGVVCFIALYWLGFYEESHPPWMRWLFKPITPSVQVQVPRPDEQGWHHPKLTGYRIILLVLAAAFGIAKGILSFKGRTAAPNLLDWQFGVVCITVLFWLGWYEKSHPPWMRWLFSVNDTGRTLWNVREMTWDDPNLTGYRILVITVTLGFGISKSVLAWEGKVVAATSLDLVLGVFWTVVLFWLGLYENNFPESWNWFFMTGYFLQLTVSTLACVALTVLTIITLFFWNYIESIIYAPEIPNPYEVLLVSVRQVYGVIIGFTFDVVMLAGIVVVRTVMMKALALAKLSLQHFGVLRREA